jgi:predicted nucleic acid-binding protein
MATLFWDASSLAKRYAPEQGTATVEALFAHAPALLMLTTCKRSGG